LPLRTAPGSEPVGGSHAATPSAGSTDLTRESIDIIGDQVRAGHGCPHETVALLRHHARILRYDRPVTIPFCTVTEHDDLVYIGKTPEFFENALRS